MAKRRKARKSGGKLHSCRIVKSGSCLCKKGKRSRFAKASHCR